MKYSFLSVALVLLLGSFALGHLTGGSGHGQGCGLCTFFCNPASWLMAPQNNAPKIPHLIVSPEPLQFHLTSFHQCSIFDQRPHDGGLLLIDPDSNGLIDTAIALFKRRKMMLLEGKKFGINKPFYVVIRLKDPQVYRFKVSFAELFDYRYAPIKSEAITMPKVQRGARILSMSHDYLVASEKVEIDLNTPFAQASPAWIEYGDMDEKW